MIFFDLPYYMFLLAIFSLVFSWVQLVGSVAIAFSGESEQEQERMIKKLTLYTERSLKASAIIVSTVLLISALLLFVFHEADGDNSGQVNIR